MPRPLVVDLDHSLIRTDVLLRSGLMFLREHPLQFLLPPLWLWRGRAVLKEQLALRVELDASRLPYEPSVVALLREAREQGRETVLATASHARYARQVADHLGLFDRVLATEGGSNLKGSAKARELVEHYGREGFDYVGDSRADVPVWAVAHTAYLVNPSRVVLRRARALGKPLELLGSRHA